MGKKSTPAAPDYTAAAEKTAESSKEVTNQQTWANRADQYNPWGSQTWDAQKTADPSTGQQVTKWVQNTTLTPEAQSALNDQLQIQQDKSAVAKTLIPRMQQEYGSAMDWSQLSPWANTPLQGGNLQATTNPYGFGPQQQRIDTSREQSPWLNADMGEGAGTAQGTLNYGNLQGVDQAGDTRQKAYDAIYGQATSRLDPQFAQQQANMETQLANKGITEGSSAYTAAMDQFNRQKTDAYNQAMMSATQGAGQQAQVDYGINMGLRQQQAGEAQQAAQYGLGAQGQNFQQTLAAQQANNAALGAQYTMGQQGRAQQLAAQQAKFQQQLGAGQYGLQQQQQGFAQNQAAGGQNFNQQLQSAQFQNQQRQQQLTEMMQQRGFSLNEINAILNGQQVQAPQFGGYNQAAASQGVDYSGAASNQYGAAMDAYNAQAQQQQAMMGAVTGLAGSAMSFSDRRLKRDIRRVGKHPLGFGIYTYRFIGERGRRRGVIAQEVYRIAPELVHSRNGVLMVDYAQL